MEPSGRGQLTCDRNVEWLRLDKGKANDEPGVPGRDSSFRSP